MINILKFSKLIRSLAYSFANIDKPLFKETNLKKESKFVQHKPAIQSLKRKQQRQASNQSKQPQQINWKKYDKQISQVLTKKQLLDIDLSFLAKKIQRNEFPLNEQLISILKMHIKSLKNVDFSLLPQLLNFTFSIGLVNPPQLFIKIYVEYYKNNIFSIEENQSLDFPEFFLKKIAYETIMVCGNKTIQQLAISLKYFGSVLSVNQMKKIDEFCVSKIESMNGENIVKLLNLFRQIRKTGAFVQLSSQILLKKQSQLSSKSFIMTIVSFLELGNRQNFNKLQSSIFERIRNHHFTQQQTISLLHILHKYKIGNLQVFVALQKYFTIKNNKISFQYIFLIMSGLTRNYRVNYSLLVDLIEYEPTLQYTKNLKDKQFIEFYFVLYAHFASLQASLRQKYQTIIIQSIKNIQLKSVYLEIKYFFLYLFDSNVVNKKQYLKKTYPDDLLISLLSHIASFENTDIREKNEYQQDILSRYPEQIWRSNKKIIVSEQFIRYKLMSIFKKEMNKE